MKRSKSTPFYQLRLHRTSSVKYQPCLLEEEAAQILHKLLDHSPVEQMVVIYINSSAQCVGIEKIAIGGLETVSVMIRDILRGAICAAVPRIIIGHNHPAGNPLPSIQDMVMTADIVDAAQIVGIEVSDHVIVCPNGKHFSIFAKKNSRKVKKAMISELQKLKVAPEIIEKITNFGRKAI